MLTVGAGKLRFRPGDVLELDPHVAKQFIEARAARSLELPPAPKPKPKKKTAAKQKAVIEKPADTFTPKAAIDED